MTDQIGTTREGAVPSAALRGPEKKNAITSAAHEALIDVLDKAERAGGALVLSGKGGVVAAGNDIADFLAIATGPGDATLAIPAWRLVSKLVGFRQTADRAARADQPPYRPASSEASLEVSVR